MKNHYKNLPLNLQSKYLQEGCLQEHISLHHFKADHASMRATAQMRVHNPYSASYEKKERPILKSYAFERGLGQMIIAFNCTYFNKTKDELEEFIQTDFAIKNKKKIYADELISLEARCEEYNNITRANTIRQTWKFRAEQNSYYGTVRFVIKTP